MSFQTLHTNLITLINSITAVELGEVSGRPKFDFSSFPGVFVAESGNENDYESTQDNLRVYGFNIWVFTKYEDSAASIDEAYETLRQTVDAIVDALDEQESPNSARSLATSIGTGKTLTAVVAQPSRFAYDEVEKLVGAQILVKLKVLVDLTQITP